MNKKQACSVWRRSIFGMQIRVWFDLGDAVKYKKNHMLQWRKLYGQRRHKLKYCLFVLQLTSPPQKSFPTVKV